MSDNKIQFVEGKEISVWKTTGVRQGKHGPTSSERTNQGYPDLEPTEKLLVLKKYGSSKALVRRPERAGEVDHEFILHINHVNPSSPYYANRNEKKPEKLSPKDRLAKAEAEAKAVLQNLEAAKAAIASEQPAPENTESDPLLTADQDEAAALFASG